MKSSTKNEIVSQMAICLQADVGSTASRFSLKPYSMFTYNHIRYEFYGAQADAFQSAIGLLHDDTELTAHYSPKAITRNFYRFIAHILQKYGHTEHKKTIRSEYDIWRNELLERPEEEFTYYTFVEGLLVSRTYQVSRVTFEPLGVDKIEQLFNEFANHINNVVDSEEERVRYTSSIRQSYFAYLPTKDWNQYSIVSTKIATRDVDYGREQAIERFQEVLRFLRFHSILIEGFARHWAFGLKDEFGSREINCFALADEAWSLNSIFGSYCIDLHKIWPFKTTAFADILDQDAESRNELEIHIMRAIYWMSKATQEQFQPDRFLNVCIASESLLCQDDRSAIGKTLGERAAFLLFSPKDHRKQCYEHWQKIYRIRSQLAHTGSTQVTKDLEKYLPIAVHYTIHSILAVAHLAKENNWQKFDEMREYLDELKFGNEPVEES